MFPILKYFQVKLQDKIETKLKLFKILLQVSKNRQTKLWPLLLQNLWSTPF